MNVSGQEMSFNKNRSEKRPIPTGTGQVEKRNETGFLFPLQPAVMK
jgi:hypothetical protein